MTYFFSIFSVASFFVAFFWNTIFSPRGFFAVTPFFLNFVQLSVVRASPTVLFLFLLFLMGFRARFNNYFFFVIRSFCYSIRV